MSVDKEVTAIRALRMSKNVRPCFVAVGVCFWKLIVDMITLKRGWNHHILMDLVSLIMTVCGIGTMNHTHQSMKYDD